MLVYINSACVTGDVITQRTAPLPQTWSGLTAATRSEVLGANMTLEGAHVL
jgi:hypothetical protein